MSHVEHDRKFGLEIAWLPSLFFLTFAPPGGYNVYCSYNKSFFSIGKKQRNISYTIQLYVIFRPITKTNI